MVTAAELLGIGLSSSGGCCGSLQSQTVQSSGAVTQGQEIWFTPGSGISESQGGTTISYDLTSLTLVGAANIASPANNLADADFSPDGTKLWLLSHSPAVITQYTLSTAFDISSASLDGSYNLPTSSPNYGRARGMKFDPAGNRFIVYVTKVDGVLSQRVVEFTVSTNFDVTSTVTPTLNEFSVGVFGSDINEFGGMTLSNDGTKMLLCNDGATARYYTLSTAFDVTTISFNSNITISQGNQRDASWAEDGSNILFTVSDIAYKYNLSTTDDITSRSDSGQSFDLGTSANARNAVFYDAGTRFYEIERLFIQEYTDVSNFIPNADSFVIGFSTSAAGATTDFTALISSNGIIDWTGATVGDTLNLGTSQLEVNGAGVQIGVCVEADKFILVNGNNDPVANTFSEAEIIEATINAAETTWFTKDGSGFLSGLTLPDTTGTINSIKITVDDKAEYEVLTSGNIDMSANKAGSFLPLNISYKKSVTLKGTASSTGPNFNIINYNKETGF